MPRRPPTTEEKTSMDTDQDKEEQPSQQAPMASSNFKIKLVETPFSYKC
jgi:hypothetical protein